MRTYPDGGHDVQYRHLDQILLDMATGGAQVLICDDDVEKMVSPAIVALESSNMLGLCVWQN